MLPFNVMGILTYVIAENNYMEHLIKMFRYFSDKKFSTIAGTLVYFLLMSITPLLLWLTLIFGKINIEGIISHTLFSGAAPFISYLKEEAESAAGGAGLVLLITTLYSMTNFFYHLRRSGEIIYDSNREKTGGIKLRVISLLLIIAITIFFAVILAAVIWGEKILEMFLSKAAMSAILTIIISVSALFIAIILNLFICPYKIKIRDVLTGSYLTTALWLVAAAGFNVYLQFASPEKLYGKIAIIFVFLLWCYVMMCCLVIGSIYNGIYNKPAKQKLK